MSWEKFGPKVLEPIRGRPKKESKRKSSWEPGNVSDEVAISLVLPTRGRVDLANRLLNNMVDTAERPDRLEVVLYLDCDDKPSHAIQHSQLKIIKLVRPRAKMGVMCRACCEISTGPYIMLLNDDVLFRTGSWDTAILRTFSRFPDGVAMVWCNDLFRGATIPNFPVLPRRVCELMGGICPADYSRDYVDTHLFDIFKKLESLGHPRLAYLQEVIVEHMHPEAGKAEFDPTYVKIRPEGDELTFIAWDEQRQIIAETIARHIDGKTPCAS